MGNNSLLRSLVPGKAHMGEMARPADQSMGQSAIAQAVSPDVNPEELQNLVAAIRASSALSKAKSAQAMAMSIPGIDAVESDPAIDPISMLVAALTAGGGMAARGAQTALDPAMNWLGGQVTQPASQLLSMLFSPRTAQAQEPR